MNQITKNILMIRPSSFGYNEYTSKDNFFQSKVDNMNDNEIQLAAIYEFENMCSILRKNGINIIDIIRFFPFKKNRFCIKIFIKIYFLAYILVIFF